jgi:hypothetical protein
MDSLQVLGTLEAEHASEVDHAARGIVYGALLGGVAWVALVAAYALISFVMS